MLDKNIYLMDGATGTELQKQGMPLGACTEQWILQNPEKLTQLQRSYVEAGSKMIYAPTMMVNGLHLSRYGIECSIDSMCRELVELSRSAAGDRAMVIGGIGPTGLRPAPYGDGDPYELMGAFAEQVRGLELAEVDMFGLETQTYLCEAKLIMEAIREISERPVIVSFYCGANGRTADGFTLADAADELSGLGVAAFGINCIGDLELNARLLEELHESIDMPLVVKPSAGLPKFENGAPVYDMPPERLAAYVRRFADAGAHLIGGCCGTDVRHIAAMKSALAAL